MYRQVKAVCITVKRSSLDVMYGPRGVLVSPETSTTVRKLDDADASQLATDVPGYEVILLKLEACR